VRLIVVSDLHVRGEEDPLYHSLLSLLATAGAGDTVVLAGDVFDLFVGNKALFRDRYAEFAAALQDAGERGARMHYIEGNHDFLIRRAFGGIRGLTIHPHHVSIQLQGKRFFFAHGDTVDRRDYGYRALRTFFRSPVMKALVAVAPGEWLDAFGKKSSGLSSRAKPRRPEELPIERAERLRKAYRSYAAEKLGEGYDFVVLGHCHDLDEMKFRIGEREGQYVNVGYPRVHQSFLLWEPAEGAIRRVPLPAGLSAKP
jgi:UDP-2,3-diacylglucosamine hydrolase